MSDYVMRNFGFTPLDQTARCVVTGGESDYGVLGDILEDLLNGLAGKMVKQGYWLLLLPKTLTVLLTVSKRDGTNENVRLPSIHAGLCVAERQRLLCRRRWNVRF